jgi:hypothetical protein
MTEHLSNGQFARKEVSEPVKNTKKQGSRFKKGQSGNPAGRPKGALNKTTRKVKEFLAALVDDPDVQEAVQSRILKGDAVAFFRALEHVLGKPKENEGEPIKIELRVGWQK